jgi:hypothetical protein
VMASSERRAKFRLAGYAVAAGLRPEAVAGRWLTLLRTVSE